MFIENKQKYLNTFSATSTQFEYVTLTMTTKRNDQKPKKEMSSNQIQEHHTFVYSFEQNHKELEQVTPQIVADAILGN